jgi:predicted ATPase
VLNGQALNALRLVPYFVFSKLQETGVELDLLLLDDPTQSFDTARVEALFEELSSAASHAQVVVVTHDDDRFTSLLKRFFSEDERIIIRVTGFVPGKGPVLELE